MSKGDSKREGLSRRAVLAGLPALAGLPLLGGCMTTGNYGYVTDGGYSIPPIDMISVDPSLLRQEVAWRGPQKPGTIVVNIAQRRLYLVQPGGTAIRYGVGIGRAEVANFRGSAIIGAKAEWPRWTPTEHMLAAIPRYRPYASGLPGGLENPLGARALYLYRDGHDTNFRLHGTNEPESIGHAVSSGCIRMFNQDIIDLYNRVKVGTPVTVLQS